MKQTIPGLPKRLSNAVMGGTVTTFCPKCQHATTNFEVGDEVSFYLREPTVSENFKTEWKLVEKTGFYGGWRNINTRRLLVMFLYKSDGQLSRFAFPEHVGMQAMSTMVGKRQATDNSHPGDASASAPSALQQLP